MFSICSVFVGDAENAIVLSWQSFVSVSIHFSTTITCQNLKLILDIETVMFLISQCFPFQSHIMCVFASQKTRKVLAEKIAQLNSAIDGVSGQLRSEEDPDEVPVSAESADEAEAEAAI